MNLMKNTLKFKFHSLAGVALLGALMMGTSQAAIFMLDNMFTETPDVGTTSTSWTIDGSSLDFTGGSKLVVTIANEGGDATAITYGELGLTLAESSLRQSIWYLDLGGVAADTNFDITYSAASQGYAFSAYVLSGTAAGVSATGDNLTDSPIVATQVNLTTPTPNEFVIAGFTRNNALDITADAPLTRLFYGTPWGNSYAGGSAYGTLGASDDYVLTFPGGHGTGSIIAASFAAVPEPSVSLLGALGSLALLRRRR